MMTARNGRRFLRITAAIVGDVYALVPLIFAMRQLHVAGFWPEITLAIAVAVAATALSGERKAALAAIGLVLIPVNILLMAWVGITFFL